MEYLLVFLAGILAFISPCILPLVPLYISYFAASENENKGRTYSNVFGFILGFTVVFVLLGAFAGTLGQFVQHNSAVQRLMGVLMVLFGLSFLGVINLNFIRSNTVSFDLHRLTPIRSVLFGIIFAISWTPCVDAFLGSALILASNSATAVQGMFMLTLFSCGLAIPFILCVSIIHKLKNTFDFIKRHYSIINVISAGILIVVGLLMITGKFGYFLAILSIRR